MGLATDFVFLSLDSVLQFFPLLTAKSHPATLTSEKQISGRRMFYEELFEKLNMSGVDYVVVGGVALVLHGVVRRRQTLISWFI